MIQCLFLIGLNLFSSGKTAIIHGYLSKLSVKPGESVEIFLNSEGKNDSYSLKLYDLGGSVVSEVIVPVFPQKINNPLPYQDGFGYKSNACIVVPKLKSGIYLWEHKIPMIVKAVNPKIVVVYASNTENAYCNEGGKSLYTYNSSDRVAATKVSFLRPIAFERFSEAFFEWMFKKHMEGVGYIDDADMDDYSNLKSAKLLIITGHSEYWTRAGRKNFDKFVNEGKNAMVLSGNSMWWQVRYNESKDQLICYRKSELDPIDQPQLKTIAWSDSSLQYPIFSSIGADFNFGGYGNREKYKGFAGFYITSPSPLFKNTTLKMGDVLSCKGRELDGAPLKCFDKQSIPVIDKALLGFYEIELIGYDLVERGQEGVATWIIFRRKKNSGIVINVATTNWCASNGIGTNEDIKVITENMIFSLLKRQNIFSTSKKNSNALSVKTNPDELKPSDSTVNP